MGTTRVSAYIKEQCLHVMGVDESHAGTVPFAVTVAFEGEAPQGPLNMRRMPDNVKRALGYAQREVRQRIYVGRQQRMVESIVTRARQGDQNAMAIIMGMREQAKRGNKRAQASLKLLKKVIKQQPARSITTFGYAAIVKHNSIESAATIVVNGPSLKPGHLYHILADNYDLSKFRFALCRAIESELLPSFFLGYKRGNRSDVPSDSEHADMYRLGNTLACAKQLQDFRAHTGPISQFFPIAGWELGEDL